jgi:hypothetical protein
VVILELEEPGSVQMTEQQGRGLLGLLWVMSLGVAAIVALLARIAEVSAGNVLFLLLFAAASLMYWVGRGAHK